MKSTILGRSIPMPSVNISLPKYVVARPRKDGTFRALFEVPKRLRPPGWLPTIPTPQFPDRTGKLDAAEIAAIERHVEGSGGLLEQLAACRAGTAPVMHRIGTMPAAWAIWQASDAWAEMRPRTHAFYERTMKIILAWSRSRGDPLMASMSRAKVKQFLDLYNTRQAQRAAIRTTLRSLLDIAIDEEWRVDNPAADIRLRRTQKKRSVGLWNHETTEIYAKKAESMGWPAGARMLRLMWQTSADATDVAVWRRDIHFIDGPLPMIVYDRGKTGVPADCPIGTGLAEDIRQSGDLFLVVGRNGRPYAEDSDKDDKRRGGDFRVIRKAVVKDGGPRLLMDHLRHSAVTDALEHGATHEDTAALSTHIDETMNKRIYRQRTLRQITDVQRKRGIIE